jgi:hypothetical protein
MNSLLELAKPIEDVAKHPLLLSCILGGGGLSSLAWNTFLVQALQISRDGAGPADAPTPDSFVTDPKTDTINTMVEMYRTASRL